MRRAPDGPDTQGTLAFETLVCRIDARHVRTHGVCKETRQSALVEACISAEIETLELVQKAERLV